MSAAASLRHAPCHSNPQSEPAHQQCHPAPMHHSIATTDDVEGHRMAHLPEPAPHSLTPLQEDSLQEIEEVVDSSFNFKQHSMKQLPENLSQLPVVVCTDLGTTNQSLWRGILGSIEKAPVGNMHCMIIPSRLSEIEEKALNKWAKE